MDILKEKLNVTIIFSLIFTLGVISFFTQIHLISAVVIAIVFLILVYKNMIKPISALILFLSFIAGFYITDFRVKDSDSLFYLAPKNNVTVEGQVVSILEANKPDRTKFYFNINKLEDRNEKVENLKSKTIVTLSAPREIYSKIQIGDKLVLKGNLRVPQKASNPAQFDYAKYLQYENTFTTFYTDEKNFQITQKPEQMGWKFLQKVDNQRRNIIHKHAQVLKSPYLELLGGVVFGYGAVNPTDELKDSFRISGLLHLLAASGLNVGLIFSIWFFIGRVCKFNYRLNIIIGGLLIIIYTCMTGFSPSILRAALMIEFILLGKLIDRQADNFALISFVCFLMLLYKPSWICSISFQLSFIVTAGLVLIMPLINEWGQKFNKFWNYIINLISVPLVAQICVLPLQMFYFNTFSSYSVIANILVLPFITIVSFVGFVSSIIALLPFSPDFIIKICDSLLSPFLVLTVKISDFISTLPSANLITIQPNIFQVIVYYILALLVIKIFKSKTRNKKLIGVLIAMLILFALSFIKMPDKKLHLMFFSVRNADSCLIKTPKNHYFVIDTGKKAYTGNYSDGDSIISKYLLSKGVRKIDFVILSHLDNDHIGGTVGLLQKIKVQKVFVNGNLPETKTAKELFKFLKDNRILYEIVKNDMILFEEEDLKLRAYLNKSIDSENENSIINLLEFKDFKALFMGDAGTNGYVVLPKDTKIDVLKLGHHGAKGVIDKPVINKIKPETVIISTGFNPYGHPHYSIIDLLVETNTKYLRTDNKNTIEIITDGKNKTENCYIPLKHNFAPCQE